MQMYANLCKLAPPFKPRPLFSRPPGSGGWDREPLAPGVGSDYFPPRAKLRREWSGGEGKWCQDSRPLVPRVGPVVFLLARRLLLLPQLLARRLLLPQLPGRRLAPLSSLVISGDGPPSRFPSSPPPPSPAPRAARPREAYYFLLLPLSSPLGLSGRASPPRGCVRASRRRRQSPSWNQREGAGTPTPVHPSPLSPGGGT